MTNGLAQGQGNEQPTAPSQAASPGPGGLSAGPAVRVELKIINKLGLHARPAMLFTDVANQFAARVTVYKDDQVVDAKSVMDMLTLAASCGTTLILEAEGPDAAEAVAALNRLVAGKFDED